ncbi:hypothetical protein P152DRAFT_510837 [Eremomyces bilateralis CBS 781.70]|uniref:DUF7730 domain-containing protein n=1 Tax=Eremomyces bilateralis CBS 781.70 TaxID=1392243 RepID=A0A6G1GI74_9PEZI|nr:uncharacterized protein P152DRAFT_510837 [Eremomyces bilateralis CBS 781.70]KAF1817656.1 hypothetical protein P152DRAFT_510837 [Eremomyces bilateralis CBS 781.70]
MVSRRLNHLSRYEALLLIATCPIWCPIACFIILLDRDPPAEAMEDKLELVRQKRCGTRTPKKLPPRRKRELSQPPPLQREYLSEEQVDEPVQVVNEKTGVKEEGIEVKLTQLVSKIHPKKKPDLAMSSQQQSMLLSKLPAELREMIWNEVIGDHVLHINHDWLKSTRRFEPLRTRDKKRLFYGTWHDHDSLRFPAGYRQRFWLHGFLSLNEVILSFSSARILSLPLTCRQIYMECIHLLYQRNFFSFRHLFQLTYFKSAVLPHRLSQIRYLRLQWRIPVNIFQDYVPTKWQRPPWNRRTWEKAIDTLVAMKGLRELIVIISCTFDDEASTGELLTSLSRVRLGERGKYTVGVSWKENAMDRHLLYHGLPFRLVRKGDADWDA